MLCRRWLHSWPVQVVALPYQYSMYPGAAGNVTDVVVMLLRLLNCSSGWRYPLGPHLDLQGQSSDKTIAIVHQCWHALQLFQYEQSQADTLSANTSTACC